MLTAIPRPVLVLLAAALVLAACAGLLWVVWQLEESQKAVRTVVVESPAGEGVFVVEMHEKQGQDFIVHCNEEDFQDAFGHFQDFVQVESEPLAAPGGALVLALADVDLPEDLRPAQRAVVEVLKRHSPRKVVLVAHSECLLYDTLAAWQDDLDRVKRRQHEDLIAARQAILRWFPSTEVEIFYADKRGDRLVFLPMTHEIVPSVELEGDRLELGDPSSRQSGDGP